MFSGFDMDVLKLLLASVVLAAVLVLLRRDFPQLALPAAAAAVCVFTLFALTQFKSVLPSVMSLSEEQNGYVRILLKGAAITVLGGLSADICRDVNENALANAVELVSRGAVLVLGMPLIEALVKTALQLL